ncbi:hypothetical protein KA005_55800 [bacterium]|nr:hypothetical protein [bacterium]
MGCCPDTAAGYLEFERIDSSTANVYRYFPNNGYINDEYLIDSLRSQIEDTSKASRDFPYGSYDAMTVCLDIYIDTIVGLSKLTKEFENMSQIPSMRYYLSKDIGFTSYSIIEEWQSSG